MAAILTATGLALEPHASGARVAAVYLLVFAAGAAAFAVWGSQEVRVAAAAWRGFLGLFAGLVFTQIFLHGIVLSALPAAVTRSAAAVAIGAGAASILGALYYVRAGTG